MNQHKIKYLIIGSGPTGLGAGIRLKELNENNFLILDAADRVGGLATSFKDEKGFTWDIGGHVQFSHYEYFDQLMQKALGSDGWYKHQRESWAWCNEKFVPYPVQNNIRYFPQDKMWKCLSGLIDAVQNGRQTKPKNFKEWILANFGSGLSDEFMLPYNFKVWAYPPEQMSYQWIGERVALTDLKRVTENIFFEKDDLSWGPNHTFKFPKNGGTGAIWSAVADNIGRDKIRLKTKVELIDYESKKIKCSDGSEIYYEQLLSTMPLDLLCGLLRPEIDEEILSECKKLKHSTSHIVGLGLVGKKPADLQSKCWMYFPENNCPFYRTTVFSNYSENNVPDKNLNWSLMTETSESPEKPVDRKNLITETIKGCLNTGMIKSEKEIISTWMYTAEYGYPTPSLERDSILNFVLPQLEQKNIWSRGRFGAWKYEVSNQDHSLMQGVEWVNRMVLRIPEITLNFPETANANWGLKINR